MVLFSPSAASKRIDGTKMRAASQEHFRVHAAQFQAQPPRHACSQARHQPFYNTSPIHKVLPGRPPWLSRGILNVASRRPHPQKRRRRRRCLRPTKFGSSIPLEPVALVETNSGFRIKRSDALTAQSLVVHVSATQHGPRGSQARSARCPRAQTCASTSRRCIPSHVPCQSTPIARSNGSRRGPGAIQRR